MTPEESVPPNLSGATTPFLSPNRRWIAVIALVVTAMVFIAMFCGLYTVQPIGAVPNGATAVVWRNTGEPFFNSPDALCLERMGGVSLLCRAMAAGQAPIDRIIVRLPYQAWAYDLSTDGRHFDR